MPKQMPFRSVWASTPRHPPLALRLRYDLKGLAFEKLSILIEDMDLYWAHYIGSWSHVAPRSKVIRADWKVRLGKRPAVEKPTYSEFFASTIDHVEPAVHPSLEVRNPVTDFFGFSVLNDQSNSRTLNIEPVL